MPFLVRSRIQLFVMNFTLTGFPPVSIMLHVPGCGGVQKGEGNMPFYEYICGSCGKDFVLLQSMTAKTEDTACPYCSEKKARKIVSKFSSPGGDHAACSVGSWGGG